jgi:hypothetical protein
VVVQDNLHQWGGPVLEQPARLQPSNPTFRQVYQPLYAPCRNHVTGGDNPRWRSAGPLYATTACAESCPECPHQCYTITTGGSRTGSIQPPRGDTQVAVTY